MTIIAIFITLIFLYSLVSARLERTVATAPMVFTGAGLLASMVLSELPDRESGLGVFLRVAEVGLVLLLFTDASRTDLHVLRSIENLPARLLSVGMLLTILLGLIVAKVVLPELSLAEAGILAAILAPTDAGLGQIIVRSPRLPMRIRQALNAEAGLNDGLSVPFLMFFIALAGSSGEGGGAGLMRYIVEQLGYGMAIGIGLGLLGGRLLSAARRAGWMAASLQPLGVVALPLLGILACDAAGASMFIAAFVAGLAVQVWFKEAGRHSVEFAEDWGQLLNLSVFFLFGMLVARSWEGIDGRFLVYAVLSLTVVRMLPVAIALIGTHLHRATVLFMGWFGPRGLASIVLGLVYLEQASPDPRDDPIQLAVMATVLLSIFAHGLTHGPASSSTPVGPRHCTQALPSITTRRRPRSRTRGICERHAAGRATRAGRARGGGRSLLGPLLHALAERAFGLGFGAGGRLRGRAGASGDVAGCGGAGGRGGGGGSARGVVDEVVVVAGLGDEGELAPGAGHRRAELRLVDLERMAALGAEDVDGGHDRGLVMGRGGGRNRPAGLKDNSSPIRTPAPTRRGDGSGRRWRRSRIGLARNRGV